MGPLHADAPGEVWRRRVVVPNELETAFAATRNVDFLLKLVPRRDVDGITHGVRLVTIAVPVRAIGVTEILQGIEVEGRDVAIGDAADGRRNQVVTHYWPASSGGGYSGGCRAAERGVRIHRGEGPPRKVIRRVCAAGDDIGLAAGREPAVVLEPDFCSLARIPEIR